MKWFLTPGMLLPYGQNYKLQRDQEKLKSKLLLIHSLACFLAHSSKINKASLPTCPALLRAQKKGDRGGQHQWSSVLREANLGECTSMVNLTASTLFP